MKYPTTATLFAAVTALSVTAWPARPAAAQSSSEDSLSFQQLVEITEGFGLPSALAPNVRIVSPLAEDGIAPGGADGGTNFLIGVEVLTRSKVGVRVKEATVAPPIFGIRHVDQLGSRNQDFPGLFVFLSTDLVTPDGNIIPKNTNLANLFNVAGTDDTPGKGVTVWAGWHVLESLPTNTKNFTITVAVVDEAGRIGFDRERVTVDRSKGSGQSLTPAPSTFPGAAARFTGLLDGASERPTPINTSGAGQGAVFFDATTRKAVVDLSFAGLMDQQTVAHIHGPGTPDKAVGIVFELDGAGTPPAGNSGIFSAVWDVDPVNVERLQNGLLYFNVHGTTFPAGEVRGQILPVIDPDGPEVDMVAPRVPTSIALGPQDVPPSAANAALFFIQVSALDRAKHGLAVSETGGANPGLPTGLIVDPTQIATGGPNRNFPGLYVAFDVPLRQGNGNIVSAGQNLAPLFDIAGSEVDAATGAIRTTVNWSVGGALLLPAGKHSVTITSRVTDNAGRTGQTVSTVGVSTALSGQDLTKAP